MRQGGGAALKTGTIKNTLGPLFVPDLLDKFMMADVTLDVESPAVMAKTALRNFFCCCLVISLNLMTRPFRPLYLWPLLLAMYDLYHSLALAWTAGSLPQGQENFPTFIQEWLPPHLQHSRDSFVPPPLPFMSVLYF
jgi:hypothetical protein